MRLVCFLLTALALLHSSPALACGSSANVFAYIHSALPKPLPTGAFVAEVEFEPRKTDDVHGAIIGENHRAKIIRPIQGDFRSGEIVVRREWTTSCDVEFANGRRGFVVARPIAVEDGVLLIDPLMVSTREGYRLPDAVQLPLQQSVNEVISELGVPEGVPSGK